MNEVPHVWITAAGVHVRIANMTDDHLHRTIAMLERRGWTRDPRFPQYPRLLREREARELVYIHRVVHGLRG